MPDTKISALAAATTLAGTEVLPVVQGGATVKATITQVLAAAGDFKADGTVTMTAPLPTNGVILGASNELAMRNGANAQSLVVANTYTNSSNYEIGVMRWVSNAFEVATLSLGTGGNRNMYLRKPQNTAGSWEFGDAWLRYVLSPGPSYGVQLLGNNGSGDSEIKLGSGGSLRWSSNTATHIGTYDISVYRGAANRLDVCTTAAGTYGDVKLRNLIISAGLIATDAAAPTIASAGTIAPTVGITFISGVTTISTITPPSPISAGGGQITLIPTGIFATNTAGNIALVSTAVVSKALIMTYDTTTGKWYPSY